MLWSKAIGAGGFGSLTASSMTFVKSQEVALATNMTISSAGLVNGDLLILMLFTFNPTNLSPEVYPPLSQGTGWNTISTKDSVTGTVQEAYGVYYTKYEAGVTPLTTTNATGQGMRHLCLVFRPDIECNYYDDNFSYESANPRAVQQIMGDHTDKARVSYVINMGYPNTPQITLSNELFESFVGSGFNRYAYGISNADDNSIITADATVTNTTANILLSGIIYADK